MSAGGGEPRLSLLHFLHTVVLLVRTGCPPPPPHFMADAFPSPDSFIFAHCFDLSTSLHPQAHHPSQSFRVSQGFPNTWTARVAVINNFGAQALSMGTFS